MRARLRSLIQAGLIVIAFLNLWELIRTLRWVKPREADDTVIAEDRLRFVRNALMKAGYWRGNIGYMPEGVMSGHARTQADDTEWAVVRYVLIPGMWSRTTWRLHLSSSTPEEPARPPKRLRDLRKCTTPRMVWSCSGN